MFLASMTWRMILNNKGNGEDKPQMTSGMLEDDSFRLSIGLCCANCAFARPVLDEDGETTGLTLCRSLPPTVVGAHGMVSVRDQMAGAESGGLIKPFTVWPQMSESEWCGNYTAPEEWLMVLAQRFGEQVVVPDQEGGQAGDGAND